jgi:hypothetical protein
MITKGVQQAIDVTKDWPPEKRDGVEAAIRLRLQQPPVTSDAVRRGVTAALGRVISKSTEAHDYLRET